ncbi:hypothetical protein [Streptomyces sp. NPDC005017]|uniref:hypothetical protein n=1 Tax=Streptomyces sp. NPDC005017 TaxID=3364706 RepID=UPI00367FBEC8
MPESTRSGVGGEEKGGGAVRQLLPPPAVFGFLLLMAVVFVVSYAVGVKVGPVGPGTGESSTTSPVGNGGGSHVPEHGHGHTGGG